MVEGRRGRFRRRVSPVPPVRGGEEQVRGEAQQQEKEVGVWDTDRRQLGEGGGEGEVKPNRLQPGKPQCSDDHHRRRVQRDG